ncbi:MAG: type II secretion system protein [Planctomycetota bacterium]
MEKKPSGHKAVACIQEEGNMTTTINTKKPAFTLIELLVVMATLALLLLVILPSQVRARQSAKVDMCRNNLHQWAVAVGSFAADHKGNAPLSTTYALQDGKVSMTFPNEMYLDQNNGQLSLGFSTYEKKVWQERMISQEVIGPYLPGFNDMGLRWEDRASFTDYPENFQLEGVWKCPSQPKQPPDFIMSMLTGAFGNRSFFRLDYSYLGRADLWHEDMFPALRDRDTIVGKVPASGRVMVTDSIFWWSSSIVWYNHGSEGSSYEGPLGDGTSYLKSASLITGINMAFGDGSVKWKKINSDDRFQDNGWNNGNNRHIKLAPSMYQAKLFY